MNIALVIVVLLILVAIAYYAYQVYGPITNHYTFTKNVDSGGNDIACNKDKDLNEALANCYGDANCKSVMLSPWNLCRKTSVNVTGPFAGTDPSHGLYVKK